MSGKGSPSYSDCVVIIPSFEEPQLNEVVNNVATELDGVGIIVIWKGKEPDLKLDGKNYRNSILMVQQKSRGKGNAIIEAIEYCNRPIICTIDADLTYCASDFRDLIDACRKDYDMVLGDRLKWLHWTAMPFKIELGNKILTKVTNLLLGLHLHDALTGMRVFKASSLKRMKLTESGFGIEIEQNAEAARLKYKVIDLPITYLQRKDESRWNNKLLGGFEILSVALKATIAMKMNRQKGK